MSYDIEISSDAFEQLRGIKAYYRQEIIDAIDKQLTYEPTTPTRNRKLLEGFNSDFQHIPPIWQLRVGSFRVFYDVDVGRKLVSIRAIRENPPHKTTGDST